MNKTKFDIHLASMVLALTLLTSCASMPDGAKPVQNLEVQKYLGTWYEIARLDFYFEKGLSKTTAVYSPMPNGYIGVVNSGYNSNTKQWKQAQGKAKFASSPTTGQLKVSFFGPFYAPYNILSIDENYQYALIAGKNTDYLWILSRTTNIPEPIKTKYLGIAKQLGYPIENLVWVQH